MRPPVPTTLLRVGLAVVAGLVLAACSEDEAPKEYSAATRTAMITGCAEDEADPNLVGVCECAYDTAEDELDVDEFAALETRLAEGETSLPDEWVDIVRSCIREVSGGERRR